MSIKKNELTFIKKYNNIKKPNQESFMKIYSSAINLDIKKILELKERAKKLKASLNELKVIITFYKSFMSTTDILNRAISIYRTAYKDFINEEEQTILALYLLIEEDKAFLEKFLQYKGNFNEIGKYFGVTEQFAKLRFLIYRKIKNYENVINDKKKYALKN